MRAPSPNDKTNFVIPLINWQQEYGRHNLPWQKTHDPYKIWISEIMLQQTQVKSVIPYYENFINRFPDIPSLARARENSVLSLWSGLGYYSRARSLHKASREIRNKYNGKFPSSFEKIFSLPGIGRTTAAAISVFAYAQPYPILDGNVKRVFARFFGIKRILAEKKITNELWQRAQRLLPDSQIQSYTQGLMDLGATLCTPRKPACSSCPLKSHCYAFQNENPENFPARKNSRPLPVRESYFLLFWTGQRLFFEKRPGRGIWGGLWSFPEAKHKNIIPELSLGQIGVKIQRLQPLRTFRHSFTHFHLKIKPLLIHCTNGIKQKAGLGRWVSLQKAEKLGLPTPVKKLVQQIRLYQFNSSLNHA